MSKKLILDGERFLDDDYPVHWDYAYVCDGDVIMSPVDGTVRDLKRALEATNQKATHYERAMSIVMNCTGDMWACAFAEAIIGNGTIEEAQGVAEHWREEYGDSHGRIRALQEQLAEKQNALEAVQAEMEAVKFAAHMPDDYEFGLPSWINQRLYACWIGMTLSPALEAETSAHRATTRELEAALGWLVEAVIRSHTIAATPDKEAWLRRARECGRFWVRSQQEDKEHIEALAGERDAAIHRAAGVGQAVKSATIKAAILYAESLLNADGGRHENWRWWMNQWLTENVDSAALVALGAEGDDK